MKKLSVPFKERKGRAIWPKNQPLALGIYIGIEEWDETNIVEFSNAPPLTPRILKGLKRADLSITSTIQYGFEVGIWRILEILDEFHLKVSMLTNGLAAERHPDLIRELVKNGHELIGHGYDQSRFMAQMTEKEQHEVIKKCQAIFEHIAGYQLAGWGSAGTFQFEETIRLLAREGFDFHIGLHDDEIPYFLQIEGRELVEIPYRIVPTGELNDYGLYGQGGGVRVGEEALRYMKAFFDAKYKEGSTYPQFAVLGLHPYVTGRPDRAGYLREFLWHATSHSNVWLTNFGDVARWAKNNPGFFRCEK